MTDAEGPKPSGQGSKPRPRRLTTQAAKDVFVEQIQKGATVAAGLEKIGYARKTYEEWRRLDPAFRTRVDQARQLRKPDRDVDRGERLGFTEWRKKYLHQETYWHQHQWIDLLEGRDPRDLHPSQIFEPGNRNRILVNCPPFHAKTATLTEYVVYRLCMDPSFRVLIISAGQALASSIVYDIQQILSSPDYLDLQKAYAPDGGWEATAESWKDSQIIFGSEVRASGLQDQHQKDPNVLALGMRSKVYGRRADLIIVDDGIDHTNVSEHAKQLKWLRGMVESRLENRGRLVVIGTRIASVDLYSELMKADNYANSRVPWTYLASPAILDEGRTPAEHVTLWPRAAIPWVRQEEVDAGDACMCGEPSCAAPDANGEYARWDGHHLEIGPRASNNNTEWALIFQQRSVAEDATFPEHAITKSTNGLRQAGLLKANTMGHPFQGMHGMRVIAGLDPAIKGFAAIVVYAVDRETKKRYILNAFNMKAPTKKQLEDKMKDVTVDYGVHEWRVEKTGLLQFFTQDEALRGWFVSRGVMFREHLTGSNKNDASYGVSSLGPLFGEYDRAWDDPNSSWRVITPPLVELPRAQNSDALKALVHQLITWTPELDPNKVPCDLVMALWFCECAARDYLGHENRGNLSALRQTTRFVSPRHKVARGAWAALDVAEGGRVG